ncbi:NAD(P)/FAD-dependent oxidoreductase [Mechercharimyces sp. CAU 1602]|uniref:phytoene desaturase family protein n=1 Tax=Mechercharimyces sp. CAU 1602 TaxID=2973933 RepID=UPI0028682326|nr:NAD(P)/FAD-dependent oxidoreductase [Mechercharimyces sp. CAU 1602]
MTNTIQTCDVAIIGGGLSGLTAAQYLAQSGLNVLILEKGERLGGRAQTQVRAGAHFNLGPHAFYHRGEGLKILKELGLQPQGGSPALDGKIVFQKKMYSLPASPTSVLATTYLHPVDKIRFITMMSQLPKLDPQNYRNLSVLEWVQKNISSNKLRLMFLALCRLSSYSHQPEKMSATVALTQLQRSMGGVRYIDGGWETVIQSLAKRARTHGVQMRTGTTVARIEGEHPQFHLHLSNGEKISTTFVLSTVGLSQTAKLVADHKLGKPIAQLASEMVPVYGATLDIVTSHLPARTSFALGADQPVYYANHSKVAALTDNPEHSVLHVFKYLHEEDIGKDHKTELLSFIDTIQPGWHKHVLAKRYLPRLQITEGLATVKRLQQTEVEQTGLQCIPGLYFAGDWLFQTGLLADAAIGSGKRAAADIVGHHWKGERHDGDFRTTISSIL